MSWGLKAISSADGLILIDTETSPNRFAGKATRTLTSDTGYRLWFNAPYQYYFDFANHCYKNTYITPAIPSGKIPIIYVYTAIGVYAKINGMSLNTDGTWTVSVFEYPSNSTTQLYCFYDSVNSPESSESFGMRLRDASNNLIFDSGWGIECTNYVGTIAGAVGSTCTYPTTITKPAICYNNLRMDGIQAQYTMYYNYSGSWIAMVGPFILTSCVLCGRDINGRFKTRIQRNFAELYGATANTFTGANDITKQFPIIDCTLYDNLTSY